MRTIRLTLWIAVAIALFALGALIVAGLPSRGGLAGKAGAPLGGPFSLVDHRGEQVSEAIFRGKPSVTLFGFTHCPDVCPTALMRMARWADELGPDAEKLRFVFVTVDPERDTQQMMSDYVAAFSDRIVGVTGEPDAVHAMTRDYKIFSRKVPLDGGDYTMDHTASMILQDADGNFVGTIDNAESNETGLEKLERLVAG
ncbi:MAG: SCO family protein [Propylenella sp.]